MMTRKRRRLREALCSIQATTTLAEMTRPVPSKPEDRSVHEEAVFRVNAIARSALYNDNQESL